MFLGKATAFVGLCGFMFSALGTDYVLGAAVNVLSMACMAVVGVLIWGMCGSALERSGELR